MLILSSLLFLVIPGVHFQPDSQDAAKTPEITQKSDAAIKAKAEADQRDLWKESLRTIGKAEDATMLFDVNPNNRAPYGYDRKLGGAGLDMLAQLTIRVRREIDGVQVFVRDLDATKRKLFHSHVTELAAFLDGLDPKLASRLSGDGLPVSLVPDNKKWFLRSALGEYSSIGPGMSLQAWNKTVLKVSGVPWYESKDPLTGRSNPQPLGRKELTDPSDVVTDEEAARALAGAEPLESKPIAKPISKGELDYHDGELVTLGTVVDKAQELFKVYYLVDARLLDNYVFVRGSFSRKMFEDSLQAISKVPMASPISYDPRTQTESFDQMMNGPLKSLLNMDFGDFTDAVITMRDAMAGKSFTLGQLQPKVPNLPNQLSRDTKVNLLGGFRLRVMTLMDRANKDGKTEHYWAGGVPIAYLRH